MPWRRPAFLQHPLAREVALAITVKLMVITVLFYAFFAGRAVPVNDTRFTEHLTATNTPQTTFQASTPGTQPPQLRLPCRMCLDDAGITP